MASHVVTDCTDNKCVCHPDHEVIGLLYICETIEGNFADLVPFMSRAFHSFHVQSIL